MMKTFRRIALVFCILAATALALASCVPDSLTLQPSGNAPSESIPADIEKRTGYEISLRYDETTHTASATQTITYTNCSKDTLLELYLHIYPNHFKEQENVEMVMMGEFKAYPDNLFNPGSIDIEQVAINGNEAGWDIQGEEGTLLHILLASPLKNGDSTTIELRYELQLPNRIGRFAWEDVSANFGNWYPIIAVYDDEGWNLDKYYEIGDPFYSETADYTVTLDIPEGMELASSGRAVNESASDGRQLITVEADMVRDFAFALSHKYTVSENDVDGVNVRVLTTPGDPYSTQAARDAATSSLKAFDSAFGQYAGDTLTVAFVDNVTGMEYPGIVFIDHTLLTGAHNVRFLKVCIVHEIAHQWWFSAVGNDEVDEPWLDESLTSFSEYVYIAYYRGWSRAAEAIERTRAELTQPLLLSLKDQESWEDYGVIYSFGPEFFLKLREELGGEIFDAMLREYYADYKYKVATTEDLRVLIVQAGNRDAIEWFDECVYGK